MPDNRGTIMIDSTSDDSALNVRAGNGISGAFRERRLRITERRLDDEQRFIQQRRGRRVLCNAGGSLAVTSLITASLTRPLRAEQQPSAESRYAMWDVGRMLRTGHLTNGSSARPAACSRAGSETKSRPGSCVVRVLFAGLTTRRLRTAPPIPT